MALSEPDVTGTGSPAAGCLLSVTAFIEFTIRIKPTRMVTRYESVKIVV